MAEFDPKILAPESRYRFLRLDSGIFVTRPYRWDTNASEMDDHDSILLGHNLRRDLIEEMILRDVDSADGGFFTHRKSLLLIHEMSKTYGVPVVGSNAREITKETIRKMDPNLEVFTDPMQWSARVFK